MSVVLFFPDGVIGAVSRVSAHGAALLRRTVTTMPAGMESAPPTRLP